MSPHPKDFTDDVIEAIKDCDKVCKLVHLPLQSGSTNVLKVMNRKYSKEQFLNLVEKMKNNIPNLTISTDIIVGFPGATEEDFEDTLDVVRKVKFEQVYMFIYSRRTGTPGDKMENQVPDDVKHKRFDRLKALVENQIEKRNKEYVGTIQKILVEGRSKTNENTYLFGFEESYGCLIGTHARDKDGIAAVMALCEAAAYYKEKGFTLWDQMINIYEEYGYYKEDLLSITLEGVEGASKIKEMMENLRNNIPTRIGEYKVEKFRDYKTEKIINMETKEEEKTGLPESNVLYFDLENDFWVCVRPSGTEPKIKFYVGVKGSNIEDAEIKVKKLKEDLNEIIEM